jgi:hypothetical protein
VRKIAWKCPHNGETAQQYLREFVDLFLRLLELDQKSRRFCSLNLDIGNIIREKYFQRKIFLIFFALPLSLALSLPPARALSLTHSLARDPSFSSVFAVSLSRSLLEAIISSK